MKYSDSVKAILLATEPEKYAVNPGRDFTRNRKMGFKDFMLFSNCKRCFSRSACLQNRKRYLKKVKIK